MKSSMKRGTANASEATGLVEAALRGELSRTQARRLYRLGADAVTLALLAASRRIVELQSPADKHVPPPSTPSGMIPVYTKPNAAAGRTARGRRRRKPGARDGHPGHHRPAPTRIDERQAHRLKCCPHCDGRLQRCGRTRTRIIEDLPEDLRSSVTEHTIHRDYCPRCKKHVEPVVPDALPNAAFGHRLIGFTSWCHYGLGVTIDQLIDILQFHLQTKLSAGGLVAAWQRLADILTPWYEQIAEQARKSAHLHADETGWRVQGRTCWLWCFTNGHNCYYLIDRNRGSPVLQRFFGEAFDGILLHDFYAAYESIDVRDRQYCLAHLLRELEKIDQHNDSSEWKAFAKLLRRLIRDGIRLRKRADFTPERCRSRIVRLGRRLDAIVAAAADAPPGSVSARAAAACRLPSDVFGDADVRRMCKRLRRTGDHLFTFLDYPHIPFENNFAERQIRPAVILRKNSQSNRSDRGAVTQAVLMSVYRTLRLRGHDPLAAIADALRSYLKTGQLPPLPNAVVADG